jgi:protein TonB
MPGKRRLIVTVLVSLGLHALAVTAVLLLLRGGVPVAATVDKPTEVELVMEETKGDAHPTSAPSPNPTEPKPPDQKPPDQKPPDQKPSDQKPPDQKPLARQADPVRSVPPVPPDTQQQTTEAATPAPATAEHPVEQARPAPPTETPVQEAKREPEPAVQAAQSAPVITLHGTDSPSDARAFGDRVIPAKPDAVFHNRPPEYPVEAARNGQQGVVVVLVHVAPDGTAISVDLVRSSGYVLLDSAARDAVLRWRFLPAVKDGQPVASDMTMGFEFDDLR